MNRLRAGLSGIRSSYWFVPSLMALLAVLLGAGMIWLDVRLGAGWIKGVSWYQQIGVDGAREVLSTIAGSMVTVAGVVFSITIVALSYASSQYGPRVLTNFMSDRGNTVTLGTFIATFLYSLMVLRTIRGGEHSFVPQYSVIVAMVLAVCSIGVLIYFIHHVLRSIHINHVIERIGSQLVNNAKMHFPEMMRQKASETTPVFVEQGEDTAVVRSSGIGYIQSVDHGALLSLAQRADVFVRLRYRPGDFVVPGAVLADISPIGHWSDEHGDTLRDCLTLGAERTPEHDIMFLVGELVEIAARALYPGINDPMTATTCLDWIGAGAAEFARRELPSPLRADTDGNPRLLARQVSFDGFIEQSFGRLRDYLAADRIAALHFLQVIGELAAACCRPDQIDELREEVALFAETAALKSEGPTRRAVGDRAAELQQLLARGIGAIERGQAEWVATAL